MRTLFRFIFKLVLAAVAIILAVGFFMTWRTGKSAHQQTFVSGNTVARPPNGFYTLYFGKYSGMWRGKIFDSPREQGQNIIRRYSENSERYPFRMYISKGLHDPAVEVVRLDYHVSGNPFWLKPFSEDIVQVKAGEYLGKMSYEFLPGIPFALGFYRLQEGEVKHEL